MQAALSIVLVAGSTMLARSLNNVAAVLRLARRTAETEKLLGRACKLWEKLAQESPHEVDLQGLLAGGYFNWGWEI